MGQQGAESLRGEVSVRLPPPPPPLNPLVFEGNSTQIKFSLASEIINECTDPLSGVSETDLLSGVSMYSHELICNYIT